MLEGFINLLGCLSKWKQRTVNESSETTNIAILNFTIITEVYESKNFVSSIDYDIVLGI